MLTIEHANFIKEYAQQVKINVELHTVTVDQAYEAAKEVIKEITDTNISYEQAIKIVADVLNV